MYQEKLTNLSPGEIRLTRPRANLARFHMAGETITDIDIWTDFPASIGTNTFNVLKNGVPLFSGGSRPSLAPGSAHVHIGSLAISTADGDVISFDLEVAGSTGCNVPLYFRVTDSGGGGAAGGYFHPDKPPTSPHAKDDEFNVAGSIDPSWLIYGASDLTATAIDSLCKMSRISNTNGFSAIGKAIPAGDWNMVCKMFIPQNPFVGSGAVQGGIILFEDIADTSKPFFVNASYVQSGDALGRAGLYLFTNRITFGSTISTFATKGSPDGTPYSTVYLRLQKSGSNYTSFISGDGCVWLRITTGETFAFTPQHVGVWVDNTTGVTRAIYFDYVRFFATMPDYLGGKV